jgi:hypothetical protein
LDPDPDPGGSKKYGSCGSGTLVTTETKLSNGWEMEVGGPKLGRGICQRFASFGLNADPYLDPTFYPNADPVPDLDPDFVITLPLNSSDFYILFLNIFCNFWLKKKKETLR